MSKKKEGKIGTQSGKAEDIDARIKKLDERFPRNRVGVIPSTGLRNERKRLAALKRKELGLPPRKSRAEREKLRLLEEKIAKLKVKGKTGTQSGKAQDAKARLKQLKKKYPTASKFNRVLEPFSSSLRDYHKEKGRLSKIGKKQKKEAEVRKHNVKADTVAREIAELRDDLPKKDREKKRAKIKSDLLDDYARIRGESKAQSSARGGANSSTKFSPTNKAGGRVKKMNAGGRVKSKEKLANIETSTQKRKRKAPPTVQRALDANKGKSKASITKGIYKRSAKDRGTEYPKRRGSAKSGSAGGLKPSTILEGKLPGKKRMKSGGMVKKMDGIAVRGKTKGKIV
jgi:hypothetical protein